MPNAPIHPISTYCAASVRRSSFLLPLQSAAKYEGMKRERCREAEEDLPTGATLAYYMLALTVRLKHG